MKATIKFVVTGQLVPVFWHRVDIEAAGDRIFVDYGETEAVLMDGEELEVRISEIRFTKD